MYEDGDVVPRDYVKAVYWYKKAAEHVPDYGGAGQGRNSLGMLYLEGNGVSQDYMAAYMYFALANSKGNMEWAAEKMTSPQISEAQQKAEEWVQQHPEPRLCSQGIGFSKAVSITEKVRN
jgi:TPR repeat protein